MDRDSSFYSLFGREPEIHAHAPGRVNLIGDHTDYNGGYVLPMAIPQQTHVELTLRDGQHVRAWSANIAGHAMVEYQLGTERPEGRWIDFIQGVTAIAELEGHQVSSGFDVRITSGVPLGAGLSSSAALEVSFLRALRAAFHWDLSPVALALLGQRVEREFVGAPVGVMDQIASSLADATTALFLDTRTLQYQRIPLPAESSRSSFTPAWCTLMHQASIIFAGRNANAPWLCLGSLRFVTWREPVVKLCLRVWRSSQGRWIVAPAMS
jgi:galactokinase